MPSGIYKRTKEMNIGKYIRTKEIKLFLFVLLMLLFINLGGSSLGFYKSGNCVNIKTILNTTAVNISTLSSPDSTLLLSNAEMTKIGYTFNYSFCNTSALGTYVYDYFDAATGDVYVNDFIISATGQDLSSAKATSYVIIFIIAFIVFLGFLLIGIYLPSKNKSNEMTGYIIAISNLKYLKIFCLCLAYLIAMFISYFAWSVCYAYLDMDFVTTIFRFLFIAQAALLLPLFIIGIYFVIANWIHDNQVAESLSRGLKIRE